MDSMTSLIRPDLMGPPCVPQHSSRHADGNGEIGIQYMLKCFILFLLLRCILFVAIHMFVLHLLTFTLLLQSELHRSSFQLEHTGVLFTRNYVENLVKLQKERSSDQKPLLQFQ